MSTYRAMSLRNVSLALVILSATMMVGCRSELYDQEYGEALEKSTFFADGRISRPLVEGTIARGDLRDDKVLNTGKEASGTHSESFPMEITEEVMLRGQERFNIYCSPCHGMSGMGDGIIVQRGMKKPPSYHEPRLVASPPGYFFDVITNGFGVMYPYASRVKPEDRWAIIAYIRALQRAQGASGDTATTAVPADQPATVDTSNSANGTE